MLSLLGQLDRQQHVRLALMLRSLEYSEVRLTYYLFLCQIGL